MERFLELATAFPTAILTTALIVVVGYWFLVILGGLDLDILELNADLDGAADSVADGNTVAGLLIKLGLGGIPVTVTATFICTISWLLSYFAMRALDPVLPFDLLRYFVGALVLMFVLLVATLITAQIIKPLRPMFRKLTSEQDSASLLGQTVLIRSPLVDERRGEATLNDGGAGLILKVRSSESAGLKRGDRAVLLEYIDAQNAYRVIPEGEFV